MTGSRCPHHAKCRRDLVRPPDQLCGFHHAKTWSWCIWWRKYEYRARLKRATAKGDDAIMKGNEAISESIANETDRA